MLTYPLEERGSLPLYEYLCRCIRSDILSGTLPAGTRLPSKRALAEHLHVSVITVESAYSQLEAEGYLQALPRRGFFVAAVEQTPPAVRGTAPLPAPEVPMWRLDLSRNQVDTARFPVSTWVKLTRQVLSEEPEALLSPVPHQGLPALRQAIAADLRDFRGMAVSPEQIVIGAGAEYLYLLLAQLLGRDTVFAVEDPGYPKIRQVYGALGAACVPVPLDSQGVDPDILTASGAGALHISPNHQYPTGLVTPITRRQTLLRWAEEQEGRWILEDDYDSEFRFVGRPIPTLFSIDEAQRVIYLNTFSKTIAPSIRISYMILPPRLMEVYREKLGFYACTVSGFEQYTLAKFMAQGRYEQHLSRMKARYRQKRDAVIAMLRSSPLADRVEIMEQDAGLHFLVRLDTRLPDAALRSRAAEQGVRLALLSDYYSVPETAPQHIVVVNYSGIDLERLPEGLRRLAQAWEE